MTLLKVEILVIFIWRSFYKYQLFTYFLLLLQVKVLYDFEAQAGTGEMSLREGEILTVTRQNVGDGWWEGTNALGEAGLFPAAYTEVCYFSSFLLEEPKPKTELYAISAFSFTYKLVCYVVLIN